MTHSRVTITRQGFLLIPQRMVGLKLVEINFLPQFREHGASRTASVETLFHAIYRRFCREWLGCFNVMKLISSFICHPPL